MVVTILTIDDILQQLEEQYSIAKTEERKALYRGFLQRQQERHNYDLNNRLDSKGKLMHTPPHFEFLVDAALVFAYVMSDREIRDAFGKPRTINTLAQMKLLQAGLAATNDSGFAQLYNRRDKTGRKFGLPGYITLFDEIGQDSAVQEKWGRPLTYLKDCQQRI